MPKSSELFVKRVKQRLEELGWNVTEFARQLKIPHSGVSAYLGGKREPGFKVYNRWAEVLKVDPLWLMGRTQTDTVRLREMDSEELLTQIIQRWDIPEEKKEALALILTKDEDLFQTIMGGLKPFLKAARKAKDVSVG